MAIQLSKKRPKKHFSPSSKIENNSKDCGNFVINHIEIGHLLPLNCIPYSSNCADPLPLVRKYGYSTILRTKFLLTTLDSRLV